MYLDHLCSLFYSDLLTKAQHPSTWLSVWNSLPYRYLHVSVSLRKVPRRILPHGGKKKVTKKKIIKGKRVVLIDLDGTNLGEMDGDIAEKLSESRRAEVVLVRKGTKESCPVYELVSSKPTHEVKNQDGKKDPRQITKDISVSTKISIHDLKVKISLMKDFLTSLHNVHLTISAANVSRYNADDQAERLAEEKKTQVKLLKEIEESLTGFGVKIAKENPKDKKLQCTFRSTVTASQATVQNDVL